MASVNVITTSIFFYLTKSNKVLEKSLNKAYRKENLYALCENCFGLCCVVLPFAGGADFATIRCSNPGVRG
jgi:hypothetical protein